MTGLLCALPVLSALLSGCNAPLPFASGYVEGEYVLIAPVATSQINSLLVTRGDRVEKDQLLAQMEKRDAEIELSHAEAALAQAQAALANLLEGARPEEIRAIEAALASAQAQADEAFRSAERQRSLAESGAITTARRDDAETAAKVAEAQVAEMNARLTVAKLPARTHEIDAAKAALEGARASRDQAKWSLRQRELRAPAKGIIYDVIRSQGELGGPSVPVLSMLPDGATKLRLYVPENVVSLISAGQDLQVHCDMCPDTLTAKVSYISDTPEFTPPVIYSLENRQKLVFLIEARPAEGADVLKPGLIVDVSLPEIAE